MATATGNRTSILYRRSTQYAYVDSYHFTCERALDSQRKSQPTTATALVLFPFEQVFTLYQLFSSENNIVFDECHVPT